MYKILNKLFGWDYVYWNNTVDQGIARVYITLDAQVYYFRYRSTSLIDVVNPNNYNVVFLTCSRKKYFPD